MDFENMVTNPGAKGRLHFSQETLDLLEKKGFTITHVTYTFALEPQGKEPRVRIDYSVKSKSGDSLLKDAKGVIWLAYYWEPIEERAS